MSASLSIDGVCAEFPAGTTLLSAACSLGIEVPSPCHDERLKPSGACRMCLVEVVGTERLAPACVTPVEEGMEILTASPAAVATRRTLLTLVAAHYPAGAVERFPDKPFHRLLRDHGIAATGNGGTETEPPFFRDGTHPYLDVDMSRCITCHRCVRICDELQGQFVWRVWNRGAGTRIQPGIASTLVGSDCVSCGACADTCPTGAIDDRSFVAQGSPERWTRTVCPYCGTGCEMLVGTRGGRIVQVKPAPASPVSKGHLCVKGRYAFDFVRAPDRATEPMLRANGEWRRVSWPDAIRAVADGFRRIRAESGADSIGVLGSARATNEENYVAQKFARVALGTNNVDCCARVCHAPTAAAMKAMLGTGAATNSFDDIERAAAFLICGCNPTENHPIVGARIKQAVLRGARLIVIDPRETELARYADLHLALRPGTNIPLFNALAHVLVEEEFIDGPAVRERVAEFEEFREFIRDWPPERAADIAGVSAERIRQAARLYAKQKPAMCFHGLGMTEHLQGTEGVMALVNLALLTGNIGRPGGGVNPLRGQNNVQGSAHMGCEPGSLAGYIPLGQGRDLVESVWKAPVPRAPGLNLMQMIDGAKAGSLRALWAIGYDVALTNPDAAVTRAALSKLDFVVVQDLFLNELAREFGHVFLPACSSFEKDGTFMNSERRVQRVRKALEPHGSSRSDWEIICDVARAMGCGAQFSFRSAEEIWNEVRAVWKAGAGISYARLERGGLQWPCPNEEHPGTSLLHAERFPHGRRAPLKRVDFEASAEAVTPEFPFLLSTGRTLYQFNAGTMTMRTPDVVLRPGDTLDVSPRDAARLGLRGDDRVRVRSAHGEAALPVRIDSRVKPGELFATFHTAQVFLNRLTGPGRDAVAMTPEYKVVAVSIEKLLPATQPAAPLPP
ncbi:MAG: formate dehydrogenase subunit alpha [Terrimicrobiaceae bacterium]|nr:formate dehydrogenase subunit alpha [Terrimicrobiaceae bacterium]